MKVDEKMIEAGLKAYSSSGTHPVVTIRAIFTAMLSAAPTDYAELVERLREEAEAFGGSRFPDDDGNVLAALFSKAADAIELLSALSGVHSETT